MMESEASSDEDDCGKKKSKESVDDSFELDENNEKQMKCGTSSKPKRRRKEGVNPQLEHFVKSFNEMCQDVENYELKIE